MEASMSKPLSVRSLTAAERKELAGMIRVAWMLAWSAGLR
jgi:hypothetical protein